MYSFETAFRSFVDFIIKFFFTVFHPVFRSKQFIIRTRTQSGNYINAPAFLYLTVFILYYLHLVAAKDWFSFLDLKTYVTVYQDISKTSLIDVLFIAIPYSVLFYSAVWLLSKILFIKAWKKLFIWLCIYWTCSVFLLFVFSFISLLVIIFVIAPDNNFDHFEKLIPKWLTNSLGFLIEHYEILAVAINFLIISGLVKLYYRVSWRLLLKLLAGLLLCTDGILLGVNQSSFEMFAWQEKLLANEPDTSATTEKLSIFNNDLDYYQLDFSISKMPDKDSLYQITGNFGIRNNTSGTVVISRRLKTVFYQDTSASGERLIPTPEIQVRLLPSDTSNDLIILKPQEINNLKINGSIRCNDTNVPADSLANVLHSFLYSLSFEKVSFYGENKISIDSVRLFYQALHFVVR